MAQLYIYLEQTVLKTRPCQKETSDSGHQQTNSELQAAVAESEETVHKVQ